MQSFLFVLIITLTTAVAANCQLNTPQKNKVSIDSLLDTYRGNRCSELISDLRHAKRKIKLDRKLLTFLNDFYMGKLDIASINETLSRSFGQSPWRFDQIFDRENLTRIQGRIRSFGNIEAFIGLVYKENEIVGRRIYFLTRSKLNCRQPENYLGLPDLEYLSKAMSGLITFPLDLTEWYTFIHSAVWIDPALTLDEKAKVQNLLSKSSAL